jgi:phosphoglycerate dehydrogenase-like enzyme
VKILVPRHRVIDGLPELDDPADVAVPFDPRAPIPGEHLDAEVLAMWGVSPQRAAEYAMRLTNLLWVQTFSAGPDVALAAGFAPHVVISCGRGLHDVTVTEHCLALVLALVRSLPKSMAAQHEHRWDKAVVQEQEVDRAHYTLDGAHVVIWGFGSIAAQLSPHLTALGAHVTGVAHTPGTRAGHPVVGPSQLPELLPTADWLISLLPATTETQGIIDAGIFSMLPRHARFVNVGRGATVDQPALIAALESGAIMGAAIDVTDPEPLPADSPLWQAPNLVITPHIAGNRPRNASAFLAEQIRAWKASGASGLRNVVTR